MRNLLVILILLFVSNLTFAKTGRTGEQVNPFVNHDKMIAQYEDYIKNFGKYSKNRKNKGEILARYKRKLQTWKNKKIDLLDEKVSPLEDRVERMKGELKRIDERKKKALETLNEKLEKFKSVLPKYKDQPEKETKLKLYIEDTEKKIKAVPEFYAKRKEDLQKNIDSMQEMVDQYYQWARLTAKDIENYKKKKEKSRLPTGHKYGFD